MRAIDILKATEVIPKNRYDRAFRGAAMTWVHRRGGPACEGGGSRDGHQHLCRQRGG